MRLFPLSGKLASGISLAAGLMIGGPAEASNSCDVLYRVQPGDSLSRIAKRVHGDFEFAGIFKANTDILDDPSGIEVGQLLYVPCREPKVRKTRLQAMSQLGYQPTSVDQLGARLGVETVSTAPVSLKDVSVAHQPVQEIVKDQADGGVRLMAWSGFSPFSDPSLPSGGLVPDLVRRAMQESAPGEAFAISFDEDWNAHLYSVRNASQASIGFPWFRPDCARLGFLNTSDRNLCANFEFSMPLYAISRGYYVRAESEWLGTRDLDVLSSARFCQVQSEWEIRPDLAVPPLAAGGVWHAKEASDCLQLLASGAVDVVTGGVEEISVAINSRNLRGQIVEIDALHHDQTVHAVAKKDDPVAIAHLDKINSGIEALLKTGEWFEVVSAHLSAYALRAKPHGSIQAASLGVQR